MIPNLLEDPSNWESVLAVSPPPFFDDIGGYNFFADFFGVGDESIAFIGDYNLVPGEYTFTLGISQNDQETQTLGLVVSYTLGGPQTINLIAGSALGTYPLVFTLPVGATAISVTVSAFVNGVATGATNFACNLFPNLDWQQAQPAQNDPLVVNGGSSDYNRQLCYDSPVDYDSGRFLDPRSKTLSQLRRDIVVRLGYAANTILPPGMAELVDNFINDANTYLYERYPQMRLERWWSWKTRVGQRFYDVPVDCTKYLDLRHVTGAWLQDDQAWFPLVAGINPLLFNQIYNSLPQYFELTDVIEVWPAPDKSTYLIHLKGQAGAAPMTADDDTTTVDSQAVFLQALANAKAHYGQPDAARYDRQMEILIGKYTAGTHYSKRYVPASPVLVGLPLPIRQVPGG